MGEGDNIYLYANYSFCVEKSISGFKCVYISSLQCLGTYRIKFGAAEINEFCM